MSSFDQQRRLPAGWNVWTDESTPEGESTSDTDPRWMRELDQIAGTGPRKTRTIPLGTLAPLLNRAYEANSSWLGDFTEDPVVIDADLHDVLIAYEKIHHERQPGDSMGSGRRSAA